MPSNKFPAPASVIEPNYFSNWGDLWFPRLANKLLIPASKIKGLTPNMVTIGSFLLYTLSAILIVVGGSWALIAVLLLPISYVLDCLDGQLARYTGQTSAVGDYLDKTLDVLKIGILSLAMSIAAVQLTGKSYFYLLGFLSSFGFLFRYYIKLETIFSAVSKDPKYLDKSRARRFKLYARLDAEKALPKTVKQKLSWVWFRQRSILALDEAEHVIFGALAALIYRPDLWLWIFAIGQTTIALTRLFERCYQLQHKPESLTYPLRK